MELIKIARFVFVLLWAGLGAYIIAATASHPALVIGITAAAAFGPYVKPWPLGAALTWLGLFGFGLLITGDGGFLQLGLVGAPIVLVLGAIVALVQSRFRKA